MLETSLKAFLAGAAAIVTCGALAPAFARDAQSHVMTLRLPDGTLEQIQYTSDTSPQVSLAPSSFLPQGPIAIATPLFGPAINLGPSFAELERISAILDQQAAEMMSHMAAVPMIAGGNVVGLPPGTSGYSMIATGSGAGICTQSVQITYSPGDAKPQIVSHTSGNCRPGHDSAVPAQLNVPNQSPKPVTPHRTIEVKADGQKPYIAMAHPVAWER